VSSKSSHSPSHDFFTSKGWRPLAFQLQCWDAHADGKSGLLNAPTGSGKTYALAIPILQHIAANSSQNKSTLNAIWITPIRALANDLKLAITEAANTIVPSATIAVRTGDTSTKERQQQKKNAPDFLITTPESLQLMIAQKGAKEVLCHVSDIVVDEWHELLGNKRGALLELALAYFRTLNPGIRIWGISATIGNLEQARQVLLGENTQHYKNSCLIKADIQKQVEVVSILPDDMDKFPWAGHLGIKLIDKIIPLLNQAKSTLIFTNTRAQSEIWYQHLLQNAPHLAGQMAMHHGSISNDMRSWVEESLHRGELKVVVCTSSLDLGVDFRPVEQIIQIGGPKGIARFLQRAGRSGHQPGAVSRIYFVPTHAIELMEASAMRKAIEQQKMESKIPVVRAFDVLCQYAITRAVGDGLNAEQVYNEVISTHCFSSVTYEEWQSVIHFISQGGDTLFAYDEFKKAEHCDDGLLRVLNRKMAMQHRLSIGTIVSDPAVSVKYMNGTHLGTVEEYFISRMKPGDVFTFAGKTLEIIQFKELSVFVRKVNKKGAVASWQGGRLPLSNQLSEMLRQGMSDYLLGKTPDAEYHAVKDILEFQNTRSIVPGSHQLLIEKLKSKDGYHVFFYPFEGRNVHEGLSSLVAYRISQLVPISFSLAFNDYGFELLSDQPIPIEQALEEDLFNDNNLFDDILRSINAAEMARRKFRDIANIAGLIFTGYPGKTMKTRHLQASSSLFFNVLSEHEPNHILIRQAYDEVLFDQLEEARLRKALQRIQQQSIELIELSQPSPFAFPIMVDRLREKLSSEKLEDRIRKMQAI
jgi:ATP-dependent Lhr-like helicase